MEKSTNTKTMKRPPIVVVMGHVDHGKTTLLDHIRKTNVATREAGGITQAIGAYQVEHNGKAITFIDTPGHEAFQRMRSHGANVADLAVLVVAADESVKPQTKEAIKTIKDSKTPFVVAINKIDKAGANIEKTKQDLATAEVFLEGFGGDVSWTAVSAKTGEGVPALLDLILLASEVEDLSADKNAKAKGIILTAHLDSRKGNVVGAILTNGTLRVGMPIFSESAKGKAKTLQNFKGESVKEAGPSEPVLILGFESLPDAGEEFGTDPGVNKPKNQKTKEQRTSAENEKTINVILKAREAGSLDALKHIVQKLNKENLINIVDASVGDIYESDVKLGGTSKAIVLGFKVRVDKGAETLAKNQSTEIIISEIIYELEKNLEELMGKRTFSNRVLEVLATFGEKKRDRQVVGGRVISGSIKNQESFEIERAGQIIGTGKIINLQSKKQDALEVLVQDEAGMLVESGETIEKGDKLLFKS